MQIHTAKARNEHMDLVTTSDCESWYMYVLWTLQGEITFQNPHHLPPFEDSLQKNMHNSEPISMLLGV
jgi:hypothetical protein